MAKVSQLASAANSLAAGRRGPAHQGVGARSRGEEAERVLPRGPHQGPIV